MTQIIKTDLTRREAALKIVEILEKFYTGNMSDITIGFTEDGRIDYDFDSVRGGSVVLPVYETTGGWSMGDWDGDYADEDTWTDDAIEGLADCFADPNNWGYGRA